MDFTCIISVNLTTTHFKDIKTKAGRVSHLPGVEGGSHS